MREAVTTVTRKGQVTVPIEIRRALGIKQGDKVAFVLENGGARLHRRGSVIEQTAGLFRTSQAPLTGEQLREAAERAIADEVVERSGS
ncbi:MAG TPA: AbrB/MazE/SpoVT family DNA-binding domain-containing protein [Chloroflexota bacterium]|nr:AbrB/MazE/SpoVT family DNA-binding domain-containing protein [Chloroflexota bacterium]